jgi:protein-S-isoprenylcysteine O-methyltransferase Ste14
MMLLDAREWWVGAVGLAGLLAALLSIFWGLWLSLSRPRGRKTGSPETMLNTAFYILGGAAYFALCLVLWRPLPVAPLGWARVAALATGAAVLYTGIALVVWGRLALGRMYNVSSSFGVQLYGDHELVTGGPYAFVRHPMYLGILLVALGGVLVYRTWTFVFLLGNVPGLYWRALREEEALALEFGERWAAYAERVPAWLPKLSRRGVDRTHRANGNGHESLRPAH